ncbi:uncharacterized protein LOC129789190 [Lutzomyia longipalpis]|uniref:uncharacterized protein LOC129789190 n=1 Tax=Lutzomyia longipalpis TaxID=7200 RepID=UPI002483A701|nr:uncharacterized protein LOC129789190 [Lutzomyia longipalpis]
MWVLLILKLITIFIVCDGKNLYNVDFLEPGSSIEVNPGPPGRLGFSAPSMRIFCYRGRPKFALHLFHSVNFFLDIQEEDFVQYVGSTPEEVESHRDSQKSLFSFNLGFSKKRNLQVHPFNQTCVGIETFESYKISLHLIRFDLFKVLLLCIGTFILFSASRLSENALFYYICGVTLGICASFLLLVYFVSKLFPQRPLMWGMMVGGWGLGFVFGKWLLENLQMIFLSYQTYVFWYVAVMGFLSFVICYRYGPPKDQRSKNLIKWGLQMLAICIVYQCSHYTELAMAINVALVVIYYLPKGWIARGRSYYRRKFPPKRRLLTSEEFYEEGVRETTRALEELRQYCSSPECRQWRTVLRLKDPSRFASFMEGSSHLMDSEILDYETSQVDISDDENVNGGDGSENEISEDDSETEANREVANGFNRWNRSAANASDGRLSASILRARGRANKSHFQDDSYKDCSEEKKASFAAICLQGKNYLFTTCLARRHHAKGFLGKRKMSETSSNCDAAEESFQDAMESIETSSCASDSTDTDDTEQLTADFEVLNLSSPDEEATKSPVERESRSTDSWEKVDEDDVLILEETIVNLDEESTLDATQETVVVQAPVAPIEAPVAPIEAPVAPIDAPIAHCSRDDPQAPGASAAPQSAAPAAKESTSGEEVKPKSTCRPIEEWKKIAEKYERAKQNSRVHESIQRYLYLLRQRSVQDELDDTASSCSSHDSESDDEEIRENIATLMREMMKNSRRHRYPERGRMNSVIHRAATAAETLKITLRGHYSFDIISCTLAVLDKVTKDLWVERTLSGGKSGLGEFVTFLHTRALLAKDEDFNTKGKPSGGVIHCYCCKNVHKMFGCEFFRSQDVNMRWRMAKDSRLCSNCLQGRHPVSECRSINNCKSCNKRHNTILHKSVEVRAQARKLRRMRKKEEKKKAAEEARKKEEEEAKKKSAEDAAEYYRQFVEELLKGEKSQKPATSKNPFRPPKSSAGNSKKDTRKAEQDNKKMGT